MVSKNPKGILNLLRPIGIALVVLFIFASCAGTKEVLRGDEVVAEPPSLSIEALSLLSSGASAYLIADMDACRPMVDKSEWVSKQLNSQVLDYVSSGAVAFFGSQDLREEHGSYVAGFLGNFPVFRAGISLFFDPAWKRRRSPEGLSYWRSDSDGVSLVLEAHRAIISPGVPRIPEESPSLPEVFTDLCTQAAVVAWLDEVELLTEPLLHEAASFIKVPADRVWLALYPNDQENYRGSLWMETPSPSHARALAALLRLIRPVFSEPRSPIPPVAKLIFSKVPSLRDSTVQYEDFFLEAQDIAEFLDSFVDSSGLE